MGAPVVPLIGVTSALGGDDAINSLFSVFKTGVSSDAPQAGSIPVRLRGPIRVRTTRATNHRLDARAGSTRGCLMAARGYLVAAELLAWLTRR